MGNLKIIYGLLISLIVVLTFSCVFQIVTVTQETYLTQRYQKKINTIAREVSSPFRGEEKLSLSEVEEMAYERGFTGSESVSYVEVFATEVVVR